MSERPRRGWPLGRTGRRRIKIAFLRMTSLSFVAEDNYLLFVAIVVGVVAGLGSAGFTYSLSAVHRLFFGTIAGLLAPIGPAAVLFLPALGGLIVGLLVQRMAPDAAGHGVPEVMTAVATRGGEIRGRVAISKIVTSALCIGSGGSAGPEGPMVQIGAASASAIGKRLGIAPRHMRTIVACGAAGGLAAVFNAPVGGAMFALEVITGELTPAFGAVILAAVSATVVSRSLFGNYPSFIVPKYDLVSNSELGFYVLFGLIAGLVGVGFIRVLYNLEDRFEEWKFPSVLKPVIGGLMVGIIARFRPEVLGEGAGAIEAATWGRLAPMALFALVPLKILSTSLTLSSGGSGGVFSPAMYVGAMLGGAFGWVVHALFPATTAGSGAYALVGIGAMLGGTALAPLTAIILLFEMTDDYRVILPVLVSTVIAIVVVRAMVGESIYTLKLRQRNIPYYAGVELQRAHRVTVAQAMRTDIPPVPTTASVLTALTTAASRRAPALPVINTDGKLVGVVTLERLATAAASDQRPASIAEIMHDVKDRHVLTTERLETLLARLGESDLNALAVVESEADLRPVGMVSRHDIMRIYERVLRPLDVRAPDSEAEAT
jgi:CIC family chloride channel protein